ncbi:hypothetical protein SXCC_02054 [Gluconacetobacter sp. SXCC-1]|nr:hypothetical protein SXCC_02054 [Gluconacetobacter sp. SXCC-1]
MIFYKYFKLEIFILPDSCMHGMQRFRQPDAALYPLFRIQKHIHEKTIKIYVFEFFNLTIT